MRAIHFVAALSLSAVPVMPALAQALTGATFVKRAGAGDLYERQSSRLVLATTRNPEIRRFARMMVSDHAKSTADVKAAAAAARIRVAPPRLDARQARMIANLRAARGDARDAIYLDQQRKAHEMALELHADYASTGRVAALKRVAGRTAPVVQHHIDMLNRM